MRSYKKIATVDSSSRLVLTDLPFTPGQRVEVVVISVEDDTNAKGTALESLFSRTHNIPAVQVVTEDEIRLEIETVRSAM